MSEEEILNYLESYIQFFSVLKAPEPQDAKMMEAVKGIIDLFNKEKEKNKKIEDKIKEKITYLQSLEFEDKLVSQWIANATTIRILQGLEE